MPEDLEHQTAEVSAENDLVANKKPCIFHNNGCFISPAYQYERFCPNHINLCPWYERIKDYLSRKPETR